MNSPHVILLQDKLQDLAPRLALVEYDELFIVDYHRSAPWTYSFRRDCFAVSQEMCDAIMDCTSFDRDLYIALEQTGMSVEAAFTTSLVYDDEL